MTDHTRTEPERRRTARAALIRNVVTPAAALLAFLAFHPAVGAALSATFAAFACALAYLAIRRPDAPRTWADASATRLDLCVRVACVLLGGLIVAAAYVGSAHNRPILALVLFISFFLTRAAKSAGGGCRWQAPARAGAAPPGHSTARARQPEPAGAPHARAREWAAGSG